MVGIRIRTMIRVKVRVRDMCVGYNRVIPCFLL